MPSYYTRKSSIQADGSRPKIILADVVGKFQEYKNFVFSLLLFIYMVMPWIKINGKPIIFIDILHRHFYLFGNTFNSQDFYLVFFLLTGVAFGLFYITAVAGRVWCGWGCPQTVFLEAVFRKIERFMEGDKTAQLLLQQRPWDFFKIKKFVMKHAIYIFMALLISHVFLSYFVSVSELWQMIRQNPRAHWMAFSWMLAITFVIYFNFAWFREQTCVIICPYGRIQSALTDDDTLVIGYDGKRGEPRGKKSEIGRGDCINCLRCVQVCPTGIDIREGLQLECIGCANCIDACDDIMQKIGQPMGLIRYDSLRGFRGEKRRMLRPRLFLYTGLLLLGIVVASYFVLHRKPFEANLLRSLGAPYQLIDENIQNQYYLHLVNKSPQKTKFIIAVTSEKNIKIILPQAEVELDSLADRKIPLFIELNKKEYQKSFPIQMTIWDVLGQTKMEVSAPFIGP